MKIILGSSLICIIVLMSSVANADPWGEKQYRKLKLLMEATEIMGATLKGKFDDLPVKGNMGEILSAIIMIKTQIIIDSRDTWDAHAEEWTESWGKVVEKLDEWNAHYKMRKSKEAAEQIQVQEVKEIKSAPQPQQLTYHHEDGGSNGQPLALEYNNDDDYEKRKSKGFGKVFKKAAEATYKGAKAAGKAANKMANELRKDAGSKGQQIVPAKMFPESKTNNSGGQKKQEQPPNYQESAPYTASWALVPETNLKDTSYSSAKPSGRYDPYGSGDGMAIVPSNY